MHFFSCASLGKLVIGEGSATKDRVCGKISTTHNPTLTEKVVRSLSTTKPATDHQHIRTFMNATNDSSWIQKRSNPNTEISDSPIDGIVNLFYDFYMFIMVQPDWKFMRLILPVLIPFIDEHNLV